LKTKVNSPNRTSLLQRVYFCLVIALGVLVAFGGNVSRARAADAPQTADSSGPIDSGGGSSATRNRAAAEKRKTFVAPVLKKDTDPHAATASASGPAGTNATTSASGIGARDVAPPVPPGYAGFNANPTAAPTAVPGQPSAMQQMAPAIGSMLTGLGQSMNGGANGNQFGPDSSSGNFGRGSCVGPTVAAASCQCEAGKESAGFKSLGPAIQASKEYFNSHMNMRSGTTSKIAINDYRSQVGCMYIIDMKDNSCYATTSSWGTGSNQGGSPTPGCGSGSQMTPAGFHVTSAHNGGKYNNSNSLGMSDLQGQGSTGRGILIHQGSCNGGASTWGCAGVGDFTKVQSLLGQGSLVYNYFGEKGVGNCSGATDAKNYVGRSPSAPTDVEEDPPVFTTPSTPVKPFKINR
jgi:hypothetical protein